MRGNGIAVVEVKNEEAWEIIKDRDKVVPAIINNNSARFNLTKKNPLMSTHMPEKLDYLTETDYATNILKRTFKADPEMNEYTHKFLIFIGKRSQLTTFSAEVLQVFLLNSGREHERKHHHLYLVHFVGPLS